MCSVSHAQPEGSQDLGSQRAIVELTVNKLKQQYVFPDVAAQLEATLKKVPRAEKPMTSADDARAFAKQLTGELQSVAKDKHLRVMFSAAPLPQRTVARLTPAEEAREREEGEHLNYGVERVERLQGNIGYIDLRAFAPLQWGGDKIAAAMNLVANTDALIIDLRHNGGGDPNTVAFMSSYLFDARTHLNNLYWREGDVTEQFHTLDWVPGRRFGQNKPVYVLTSSYTFSGAEEFSYNLKNLKRATIIGETTGGGANPGDLYPINAHFAVFVPTGRAISPITKTNWEGTGVTPDITVPADEAFTRARALAIKALVDSQTDPARKTQLQGLIDQEAVAARR